MQLYLSLLLMVAIAATHGAQCLTKTRITIDKYSALKFNWSIAHVEKALGGFGTRTSESAQEITIQYDGIATGSYATLTFLNGLLYTKAQIGLC
ncbi:unnamed protein product [Rotaria magnacalcarata]